MREFGRENNDREGRLARAREVGAHLLNEYQGQLEFIETEVHQDACRVLVGGGSPVNLMYAENRGTRLPVPDNFRFITQDPDGPSMETIKGVVDGLFSQLNIPRQQEVVYMPLQNDMAIPRRDYQKEVEGLLYKEDMPVPLQLDGRLVMATVNVAAVVSEENIPRARELADDITTFNYNGRYLQNGSGLFIALRDEVSAMAESLNVHIALRDPRTGQVVDRKMLPNMQLWSDIRTADHPAQVFAENAEALTRAFNIPVDQAKEDGRAQIERHCLEMLEVHQILQQIGG